MSSISMVCNGVVATKVGVLHDFVDWVKTGSAPSFDLALDQLPAPS